MKAAGQDYSLLIFELYSPGAMSLWCWWSRSRAFHPTTGTAEKWCGNFYPLTWKALNPRAGRAAPSPHVAGRWRQAWWWQWWWWWWCWSSPVLWLTSPAPLAAERNAALGWVLGGADRWVCWRCRSPKWEEEPATLSVDRKAPRGLKLGLGSLRGMAAGLLRLPGGECRHLSHFQASGGRPRWVLLRCFPLLDCDG